jgi:hypothetical protein
VTAVRSAFRSGLTIAPEVVIFYQPFAVAYTSLETAKR